MSLFYVYSTSKPTVLITTVTSRGLQTSSAAFKCYRENEILSLCVPKSSYLSSSFHSHCLWLIGGWMWRCLRVTIIIKTLMLPLDPSSTRTTQLCVSWWASLIYATRVCMARSFSQLVAKTDVPALTGPCLKTQTDGHIWTESQLHSSTSGKSKQVNASLYVKCVQVMHR